MLRDRNGLLSIEKLYEGKRHAGSEDVTWTLQSIARELSVPLKQPKGQVVLAVLGDARSGKSSFVNALLEELVVPKKSVPVQWAVSDAIPQGEWPALLTRARAEFPNWDAPVQVCRVASRLEGMQVVELSMRLETEFLQWFLKQVDLVVCLLDSQAKTLLSDQLLSLLQSAEAPAQFLLAKADLVRESDRIRLIAKASKLLQERLNRHFEILPCAAGDVNVLLDIIDSSVLGGVKPKWDAGRLRAWQLAQVHGRLNL